MTKMLLRILAILISGFKSNSDLVIENMALRQQLAVFKNKKKRPVITDKDRFFWIWLSRVWANWKDALIIVEPETVVRWHRKGFRKYRIRKSFPKRPGRPRIDPEIRSLIRKIRPPDLTIKSQAWENRNKEERNAVMKSMQRELREGKRGESKENKKDAESKNIFFAV